MAKPPRKITFYARLGDSEVLNEIGSVDVEVNWERPARESDNPAPGAKKTVNVNMSKALAALHEQIARGGDED